MFNRKKVKELEAKISSMRKVEDVRDRMAYQLVTIIEKKNAQKKVAEKQIEDYRAEKDAMNTRIFGLEREIRELNKEIDDRSEQFDEMYSNISAVFCQMGNTWTPEKVYFAEFLRANYDWDMVRIVINLLYRTNHTVNACQKAVKWHSKKEGAK